MAPQFVSRFRNHHLYPSFTQVKERLRCHQFVCWLAGGAVRDILLGRECEDFDLVTDASTEVLKALFPEALLVGEKFGVLKIIVASRVATSLVMDLSTFRQEADYRDGRRPSQVSASTPVQDAFRRDFTINALFWDDQSAVLRDYAGGLVDFHQRLLAAVRDPQLRFNEDHLRLLRLARFAAQLSGKAFLFKIDRNTEEAAVALADRLDLVSGERIWSEFLKLRLLDEWIEAFSSVLFCRLLQVIFKRTFFPNDVQFKLLDERVFESFLKLQTNGFVASALAPLFFGLVITEKENPKSIRHILASRLRVSRNELMEFDLFCEVMQWCRQGAQGPSLIELAIRLEKKRNLTSVLYFFAQQGLFALDQLIAALELLRTYPQPLLTGADLVGLVADDQIGRFLYETRLNQLSGKWLDQSQAIDQIKQMTQRKLD